MDQPGKAIQRSTTADRVFETLHQWIVSGRFQPGDVLPSQDELARQLQVSRNTLREAVFKLSAMGLVKSRQGVGTVVQPSSPSNYIGSLPDHLLLDRITMFEFIEARLFTERTIVRLAVMRSTPDDLERLAQILDKQRKALTTGEDVEFNRLDVAFHMELGRASGNSVMFKFIQTIWDLLNKFIGKSHMVPGNIQRAHQRHKNIYQAIKQRDAQLAEDELVAHITETVRHTADYLKMDIDLDALVSHTALGGPEKV